MIIFIASDERQRLLDESIADSREVYRYIAPEDGISLLSFVKSKMPRHSMYSELVIDRAAISENTDELIKALKLMKQMYDIRITIIADDLKEDDILAIIDLQIFNIITSHEIDELRSELKQALSEEGISQLRWLRLIRSRESENESAGNASGRMTPTSLRRAVCVIGAAAVCAILIAAVFILKNKDEGKSAAVTDVTTMFDTLPQSAVVTTTTAAPTLTTTAEPTVTTPEPEPTTTAEPTVEVTTSSEVTTTTEVTTPPVVTTTETTTTTTTVTTTTVKKTVTTEKQTTTTAKRITTRYVELHGLKLSCPQEVNGIISLRAGENAQIAPALNPENASIRSIIWESTDEDVAVVSTDGKASAVSPGTSIIKCTVTDTEGKIFEVGIMITVK